MMSGGTQNAAIGKRTSTTSSSVGTHHDDVDRSSICVSARSKSLALAFSRSTAHRIRPSVLMLPRKEIIRRGCILDDVWRRNVNFRSQCAVDGTHLRNL